MPSYNLNKKTLKPKIEPTPDDPAISDKPEPIKLSEQFLAPAASKGREYVLDQIRAKRAETEKKVEEYRPPELTDRQKERLRLEMEAGARTSARHAANAALALKAAKRDPSEGYTTPVHRPDDFVPNFDSTDPQARTVKEG